MKRPSDKALTEARALGRDEGAAWAVAALVNMRGTGTESMELAQAWGMKHLLAVADPSDKPHLRKLVKDYPGQFAALRRSKPSAKGAGRG